MLRRAMGSALMRALIVLVPPRLLPALQAADAAGMPTLTDLGYQGLTTAIRHPVNKPKGRHLSEEHQAYNTPIRGIHALAERANSLLKTTFKALRLASLDPGRIGAIVKAALVILHLEHNRAL